MLSDNVLVILGKMQPEGFGELRAGECVGRGGGELRFMTLGTAGAGVRVEGPTELWRDRNPSAASASPGCWTGDDGGGVACLLPG